MTSYSERIPYLPRPCQTPYQPIAGLVAFAKSGKDTAGHLLAERSWQRRSIGDVLRRIVEKRNPTIILPGANVEDVPYTRLGNLLEYERLRGRDPWTALLHDSQSWVQSQVRRELINEHKALRAEFGEDVVLDQVLPRFIADSDDITESRPRCIDRFTPPVFVSDVRYVNEAQRIRDLGGFLVSVERQGAVPASREEAESIEAIWARFVPDWTLVNNYDLATLQNATLQMAEFFEDKFRV